MSDRRTFLRNLVSLPLIGGGVTLIGAPSAPVPLAQAAALPTFAGPAERARYAWEAFSAAMREATANADGWYVSAGERVTALPHLPASPFMRVVSIHYERLGRGWVERNRELDFCDLKTEIPGWGGPEPSARRHVPRGAAGAGPVTRGALPERRRMRVEEPEEPIVNDPRHLAIHEAGHATISRKLGIPCGQVSIAQDEDSAGHSITADPWSVLGQWERVGRFRDPATAFRGRIMGLMAGAEAETELLGECEGGDGDDRYWIALMLDYLSGDEDYQDRLEARLRRMTKMLVRRHRADIERVATALQIRKTISGEDLDLMVPGPTRPPYDNPFLADAEEA